MIGVLDYGAGNLGSVMNAVRRIGGSAQFIRGPDELSPKGPYEKIIFPGDGHFATAMASLKKTGYDKAIREWIQADKPFLGICIGLQALFDASEENLPGLDGTVPGLSVIAGSVKRFPGKKIPQIGWNSTQSKNHSALFKGLPPQVFFYYIHSYYAEPQSQAVTAAQTEYYLPYCAAVERGALGAVQFHPEKSGILGLRLLANWAGIDYAG
ncbi:MAG: imidazole glycerol phosphate synthase subunit HisH [Spirochaetaceae bacterium]|jgi:imidazole glycerol phosphate synthase glutamine amidotransferase subunit|nr:imidazole glycerol phosphate synthase subunit HisH [Spirochaetaceae bacterium]